MDFTRIPLYSMISQRMGWLTERQRVTAQNVANADTPGYQARDLRPLDFGRMLSQLRTRMTPAATDAQHIATRGSATSGRETRPRAAETTLSGNSVSIEQEVMRAADTATDYQLVTNLYRRHLGLIRTVVGRSNGQ